MICSDQLDQLAAALSAAQAVIEGADKGNTNPHFKSKYADLASVWDACRKPLTDNGLSVVQALGSNGDAVTCTTMLLHKSGQFIRTVFEMTPQQKTPQAAGSCATYLRRYSLQALVGVAPEDDDGNAASSPKFLPRIAAGVANDQTATQKAVVEKSVAVQKAHSSDANPAVVVTFSRKNPEQVKQLAKFLDGKKCGHSLPQFSDYLEGKPWSQATLKEAWEVCNPEKPDKEPS